MERMDTQGGGDSQQLGRKAALEGRQDEKKKGGKEGRTRMRKRNRHTARENTNFKEQKTDYDI